MLLVKEARVNEFAPPPLAIRDHLALISVLGAQHADKNAGRADMLHANLISCSAQLNKYVPQITGYT